MGKPKKIKEKAKVPASSPMEGKIVKQKSHEKILKDKEQQPIETNRKENTEEQNNKTSSSEKLAGFIFMCNTQTKPECYQYRVLGLPKNKEQVILNIKHGARLFLYDFDLKLLYGIYKASSDGGMNLEPDAFGGRYPAQVKFKIHKDCLPVAEHAFRHAIKDDISKFKFKTELNAQQVETLCKLFQPIGSKVHSSAPVESVRVPPPPTLHVREPIPLYPAPTAQRYHVANERSAVAGVQPPIYRQYPVTSRQQPPDPFPLRSLPRSSRYPLAEVVSDGHLVPALERDPYRPVVQDHRYLAPIPASEMVPRDRLLHDRDYPDREMALHLGHDDPVYISRHSRVTHIPVAFEQPRYPVADYGEMGAQRAVAYDVHPSVGPPYGEVVRVYGVDPRTEVASVPVSSRYSFAGSVPVYR